jgi:hypothetical protein
LALLLVVVNAAGPSSSVALAAPTGANSQQATAATGTDSATGEVGSPSSTEEGAEASTAEKSTAEQKAGNADRTAIALAFIAFALITVIAVLVYLGKVQSKLLATLSTSIRRKPGNDSEPRALTAGDPQLTGPEALTVGVSATISARHQGAPVAAKWSVAPEEGIKLDSAESQCASVTALAEGSYTITATFEDGAGGTHTASLTLVAAAAPEKELKLPVIGVTYGTVVIAIVTVAAVAVLGLVGLLGGEALATFFGGVIGYIFVKGGTAVSNQDDHAETTTPAQASPASQ